MRSHLALDGLPLAGKKSNMSFLIAMFFLFTLSADICARQGNDCSNGMAVEATIVQDTIISKIPPCLSASIDSINCQEAFNIIMIEEAQDIFNKYQLCYEAGLAYRPEQISKESYYSNLGRIAALKKLFINKINELKFPGSAQATSAIIAAINGFRAGLPGSTQTIPKPVPPRSWASWRRRSAKAYSVRFAVG